MKYYRRLKTEHSYLLECGPDKNCKKGNRARVLRALIALLKMIREIEESTDDWSEKEACRWDEYLTAFEGWVASMPVISHYFTAKKKT